MFLYSNLKNSFSKNYAFYSGLLLLILSLTANSFAAKGNFDRTFGNFGKVISPVAGSEKAMDATVQPDGKIVVVGGVAPQNTTWDFLVQRYNADGSPDTNFGSGGRVVLAVAGTSEVAYSVTLQSDNKILVAGYFQQTTGYADFCVVRLLPDGQLDQTFNSTGRAVVSMTPTTDIAVAVAMQNLGGTERIVLGGNVGTANTQFGVARLNLDGQIDTTFGDGGTKLISIGGVTDSLQDMIVDSESKIVAVGFSRFDFGGGSYRDDFAAVRIYSGGQLDTTFSGDGKVVTQMSGHAQPRAVAVQTIGNAEKIVVGGFTRNAGTDDFALLRYNYDGTVDTTFGTNGKSYTDFAVGEDQIQKLLVQPGGKIIGVGFMRYGANQNFASARFNVNGTLDKTFGACGRITTDLGSNTDIAYGAALQSDGKFIAVGESTSAATGADFAVVRFTSGGQATATNADFDGDGKEDVSVYRPSEGVWYANCTCQGFRAVRFGLAGDIPVPADFDGDGATDQAVYRGGTWHILRSSDGNSAVVNFGLAGDIPTVGDYDGDAQADISVWRPATGVWYVLRSSDLQYTETNFGQTGDKPVPADYDGDGKTDLAIYRGSGDWWIKKSSDASGNFAFQKFGIETDIALANDFDGDGRSDLNVYRASEGNWYQQFTNAVKITRFGVPTDKPVPADFDGDGKADIAVFRNGQWHVLSSSNTSYSVVNFGLSGDLPTVVR